MPFFPLWSGVLLQEPDRNLTEGSNRDTNAVVERHFATIKNEILHKEKNINPAKACRLFYISAKGLAKASLASIKKTESKMTPKKRKSGKDQASVMTLRKRNPNIFQAPPTRNL